MNRNNKQLCYSIKNAILTSFEEQGYLKYIELDEYINTCVSIEIPIKYRDEIKLFNEFVRELILKDTKYQEFLNGNARKCAGCEIIKPISSFYPQKDTIDGISIYCKKCNAKRTKEWRLNNIDKYLESNKRNNRSNTHKEAVRKYKENNRDKIRDYQSDYYKKNKNKCNLYVKRYNAKKSICDRLQRELTETEKSNISDLVDKGFKPLKIVDILKLV